MECRLCGYSKPHKPGKMPRGYQRYFCPAYRPTLCERFDNLYYSRRVRPELGQNLLPAYSEGRSLQGISRITGLGDNTVVSIVRAASTKAQLVHHNQIEPVLTEEVSADEMWSVVQKRTVLMSPKQLEAGDRWREVTTRLGVTYFNWLWQHSQLQTTAVE